MNSVVQNVSNIAQEDVHQSISTTPQSVFPLGQITQPSAETMYLFICGYKIKTEESLLIKCQWVDCEEAEEQLGSCYITLHSRLSVCGGHVLHSVHITLQRQQI